VVKIPFHFGQQPEAKMTSKITNDDDKEENKIEENKVVMTGNQFVMAID
jgi:hypothetical protein